MEELKGYPKSLHVIGEKLKSLDLSYTRIATIPSEITLLPELTELIMTHMYLKDFPPELENLKNLRTLDLSDNQLNALPKTIDNMKNLENLRVMNNNLEFLPSSMSEMKNLKKLALQGNPLDTIPKEIMARGTPAILSYLRQSSVEETTTNWKRIKLMVMGEEGVGKTSLLMALSDFKQR